PEEEPGGQTQRYDGFGQDDAQNGKHREMHRRVGRHDSERRDTDVLACQRARECRRRVERPARQSVDHQKPQCDGQPRKQAADHAAREALVNGSFHCWLSRCAVLPQYHAGPGRRNRLWYGILARRFPILVAMTGQATPPELPPGLLEEYLAGMRTELAALATIAERLAAAKNDRGAIEALRRAAHKIHGSAGSFGFMEASRLAAGMEATAKDWADWPGNPEVERASLARWFVARLAELLGLAVPRAPAAVRPPAISPLPRVGSTPTAPTPPIRPTPVAPAAPAPAALRAKPAPPPAQSSPPVAAPQAP